ncbi:MAG: hypothetical protein JRJ85_24995 [Deltaproteobacteria bacterium]|nr:hypothetical protein [Deltaproteobacteria bacterium]
MMPFISQQMRQHGTIFLEEPPEPGFGQMLGGVLSIDDYLLTLDVEYPEFSRRMCDLLCELHQDGKQIFQVEPFLRVLLEIHAFFADGHDPVEIKGDAFRYPVYLAERNATGALLNYYQTVMNGSFDETVTAVKQFARMDAARFRLRDLMRGRALVSLVKKYSSSYIEAGVIHYPLWRLLRERMPGQLSVKPIFLSDAALKAIGERGPIFGPGDQLTLYYIFHPGIKSTARDILLSARAIIYSKIIEKEERTDDLSTFPHLRDELACIGTTKQLLLDDCRRLFPLVRRAKSADARHIVAEYLAEFKPQFRNSRKESEPR